MLIIKFSLCSASCIKLITRVAVYWSFCAIRRLYQYNHEQYLNCRLQTKNGGKLVYITNSTVALVLIKWSSSIGIRHEQGHWLTRPAAVRTWTIYQVLQFFVNSYCKWYRAAANTKLFYTSSIEKQIALKRFCRKVHSGHDWHLYLIIYRFNFHHAD